jgi:hypothetical protein
MNIPIKFKINTDDFKIFFDNNKKTHVCENVQTGEKTNIGVLGILMQMGILKPIEENRGIEERIKFLSEKIDSLENKINEVMKSIGNIPVKERKKEVDEDLEEPEEENNEEPDIVEEKPKSEIKKRIMKKVLEQTEEKEEPEKTEEEPEEESDAVVESDEEIENWMKI